MIAFANPWAWIGAIGLALPIAIHFLRRHRAARRLFPTLRFLPELRVVAVRRHRLTDVPLMIVRLLAIAAAAFAVAQPIWRNRAELSASASKQLARAVVVDRATTEVSAMPAPTTQVIVEGPNVRQGLARAVGWTTRQEGNREIVIISRFPIGSLSASDIAAVPAGVGLRFIQIPIGPVEESVAPVLALSDAARGVSAQMRLTGGDTQVSWMPVQQAKSPAIDWHTRNDRPTGLAQATGAALDVGVAELAPDRPVTIVLPEAPDRAALAAGARTIDRPWMFDVVHALATDPTIASAARTVRTMQANPGAVFTPLVYDANGGLLLAAAAAGGAESRLLLMSNGPDATVFTAALALAVPEASRARPWPAFETQSIGSEVLDRWQRPTAPTAPISPHPIGISIARWFWILALVWIVVESFWRRRPEVAAPSVVVNERVA